MTSPDRLLSGAVSLEAAPVVLALASAESVSSVPTETEAVPEKVTPRVLLETLAARYPAFRDVLPLAIGIDKQLLQQSEELGVSKRRLRIALAQHIRSTRYLKALARATHRYDLNGQEVEILTDEHRQYAAETLRERQKHHAAERRTREGCESKVENNRPRSPKREGGAKRPERKAEAAPDKGETRKREPQKPASSKAVPPPARKTKPDNAGAKNIAEEKPDATPMAEKLALLAEKFARH
ncbi:MAG: ProQ/FINO family protein [Zoogloeaceae bacterium]|jgi:ProP effector|nr:ProQ/FINO family protein [Zoogloeaceae bacterium]